MRAWVVPTGVLALAIAGLVGVAWGGQLELSASPLRLRDPAEWRMAIIVSAAWIAASTLVFARVSRSGDLRRAFRKAALLYLLILTFFVVVSLPGEGRVLRDAGPTQRGLPWLPKSDIHISTPYIDWVLGAIVLAVALLLLGQLLRIRLRFERGVTLREARFGRGRRTAGEPETVRDVLRRARHAVDTEDDTRRAIIAAYAAMESEIAAHGVDRRLAETPGEFLHDALAAQVLRSRGAAESLLDLFHAARFSHQPLPENARALAHEHLDVLEADLRTGARSA